MKFVIAYRDIVGTPASITFDADSLQDALVGLKQRCIDATNFVGDPDETSYRNAYPMVLVDESMVGHVLFEDAGGVIKTEDMIGDEDGP